MVLLLPLTPIALTILYCASIYFKSKLTMSIHLAFMESKVTGTGYDLLKEMRRDNRKLEGTILSHVVAVQKESIIVGGVEEEVNRLFVKAKDSGDYENVGWILSHHVNNCMICNTRFSTLHPRHHCRACGNVVCSKCAPEKGLCTGAQSSVGYYYRLL